MGGGGKRPANRNVAENRDPLNQNEELRLRNEELERQLEDQQALFGGREIHQGGLDGSPGFRPGTGIGQSTFNDQFGSIATRNLNSQFSGNFGQVDVPRATQFVGNETDFNQQGHFSSGRNRIIRRQAN
jgi:hypothetical protein